VLSYRKIVMNGEDLSICLPRFASQGWISSHFKKKNSHTHIYKCMYVCMNFVNATQFCQLSLFQTRKMCSLKILLACCNKFAESLIEKRASVIDVTAPAPKPLEDTSYVYQSGFFPVLPASMFNKLTSTSR
jgi:hypothetical protein